MSIERAIFRQGVRARSPSPPGAMARGQQSMLLIGIRIACSTIFSAASRARDCGNPANLVALAQIRVDCVPDGTRSSRSWRRLRD